MLIEICANSYQSALNAQKAGADRIEFCVELAVGGITPSYGLLKKVMANLNIPVNVLVRPRGGNFTYSDEEFEVMKEDIRLCKRMGCNGIVSGVLKEDQTLDIERTRALLELGRPLSFTFHRAFDWVPEPLTTLELLIELGIDSILTSGQQATAAKGLDLLKILKERAKGRIKILPGGGINEDNICLFKQQGFDELHFSAINISKKPIGKITMNSTKLFDESVHATSDIAKIKSMLSLVK